MILLKIFLVMASTGWGQNIPKVLPQVSGPAAPRAEPRVAPVFPAVPQVPKADYGPSSSAVSENQNMKPSDLLSGIIEDYTYNPANRRDPFLPYGSTDTDGNVLGPLFPLQKFDVDQLKLIGIIWDVKDPKAMILDPSGKGYVVKANERVGRHSGYIAKIRENEIVIVEMFKGSNGVSSYVTKFLRLSSE